MTLEADQNAAGQKQFVFLSLGNGIEPRPESEYARLVEAD
jgi:hypothetical protein